MSLVKVPVYGTVGKAVTIETQPVTRAQIVAWINAAIASQVKIPAVQAAAGSDDSTPFWTSIQAIPKNIVALAAMDAAGIPLRLPNGTWIQVPYYEFQGAPGEPGEDGEQGPPGGMGAMGATGATGATGPAGAAGSQGPAGQDGADGEDGLTIVGPAGSVGASGAAGAWGPPGEPGEDGEDGSFGPPGPVGPIGATGATGATGSAGAAGAAGAWGPPGEPGQDGEDGGFGPPGLTGATGATGVTGATGAAGAAGAQGLWGPPGGFGSDCDDPDPAPVYMPGADPASYEVITAPWLFAPQSGVITFDGVKSQYALQVNGNATTSDSLGLRISAGTNSSDQALFVGSQSGSDFLIIFGNGVVEGFAPSGNIWIEINTATYDFGNTTDNPAYVFQGSGTITAGGDIRSLYATPQIRAISNATGTANIATLNAQNNSIHSCNMAMTDATFAAALLTNGPTGEQGAIYTNGAAAPLVFGVNHIALMQIIAGAIQGWGPISASFLDMTPDASITTMTATGFAATVPTPSYWAARMGNLVILNVAAFTGTSNSTSFGLGTLPVAYRPARTQVIALAGITLENNSASVLTCGVTIASTGVLAMVLNGSSAGWTSSGTKGANNGFTVCYNLL